MTVMEGRKAGEPLGVFLRNPGNIELGDPWQGLAEAQRHQRFCTFKNMAWGFRAMAVVIRTYQDKHTAHDGTKIDTIRDILMRWAPPVENNVGAYEKNVALVSRIATDQEFNVHEYAVMAPLVHAMAKHEQGGVFWTQADIDAGLLKAGIQPPAPAAPVKDKVVATTGGVAAGAAVVLGTIEAIQTTANAAAKAAEPLAVYGAWVVPLCACLAAAAVITLAVRTKWLRKLVGK